ncbi:hypothetical protein P9D43_28940 [Neobacillus niacini]|uniref:accessory Sec system protein Asp2 n=1 Tax=Neobacillus niacini TaxID=86668 RepID=UPI0007AB3832|nr:accessory Sec system protein Asp2 [Neobacillus niacini]MEC1526026.1 hypothetical protein [Neobacillus niacini]
MLSNEKTYQTNLPIKYIFEEGQKTKDYLLVVFSGFAENTSKVKHAYNYMRTLKNFDCHKLFILDNYGPSGCYYIGENMSFEVETSVLSLITNIIRKYKINYENVIVAGSSKGGSAALYFGLKYNFGYVIAGAFQTKIADYITIRPEAYDYMLGSSSNQAGHDYLNGIIYKQLDKEIYTKLFFMSSKNDWQYPDHIQLFLDTLKEKNIPYTYYECEEMRDHSDVGNHFPKFLFEKLFLILYFVDLKEISYSLKKNTFIGRVHASDKFHNLNFYLVIKENSQIIHTNMNEIEYKPIDSGFYTLSMLVTKDDDPIYETDLLQEFISTGDYELQDVIFQLNENDLELEIKTNSSELKYAFYIYKNGLIIDKIMYQTNSILKYPLNGTGNYQVQYYIKDQKGKVSVNKTKLLHKF